MAMLKAPSLEQQYPRLVCDDSDELSWKESGGDFALVGSDPGVWTRKSGPLIDRYSRVYC